MAFEQPNWGGNCSWGMSNWGSGPISETPVITNDIPELIVSSNAPDLVVSQGDAPELVVASGGVPEGSAR